jgi:transaldolase / glucose-6-phosphate isomerase
MSHVNFHLGGLQKNVDARIAQLQSSNVIDRLWKKDHTIWRSEEVHRKSILNRLGWLHSVDLMRQNINELLDFAEKIRGAGFTHVVVLGMGGSSLCPDVCRATFGSAKGYPQLLVLDSTNPASVQRIENSISIRTTLFIVASKSGGTTETNMFYKYFYGKVAELKEGDAGGNFVAITDANTQMEKIALEKKFRKIFLNPEDIGGRYSALSYFGVVPMALIGMEVSRILENASSMARSCSSTVFKDNPAAVLGATMGEAFKAGKDKLTFIASKQIETFNYWTEQLIAESTGKEGKGIVPIEGEQVQKEISTDRLFVFLSLKSDKGSFRSLQEKLSAAGQPFVEVELDDASELGGEFFRWEFATSIAAVVLQINPFDEPNVKESKDNTVRVIEEFKKSGVLPKQNPLAEANGLSIFCEPSYSAQLAKSAAGHSLKEFLHAHFRQCVHGDYASVLAYIDQNENNLKMLQLVRSAIGNRTSCATTLGFGPRYLHSTGQLHKGGKQNGVFLLLTAEESVDFKIPGEAFSFEVLKNAQAIGDYRSLAGRSLRVVRVHLGKNIKDGLDYLHSLLS